MLHECQRWSEAARMQINAGKSKIMAFHETKAARLQRKSFHLVNGTPQRKPPFHILSSFPTPRGPGGTAGLMSTPLAEVPFFDYLGLRLDERVSMQPAMESILGKARKGGSQVAAVAYSLRYDKHHHNPSVDDSVQKILQLWRSLVLPHFLQYVIYL